METIRVLSDFHAAHRQIGYPGKCAHVHGHTWKGEFVVSTDRFPRDDLDMSLDFGDLKQIMRQMDHKIIVTPGDALFVDTGQFDRDGVICIPGKGPSVENVADFCYEGIVKHIHEKFPARGLIYHIKVCIEETDHNFFTLEKQATI